jgi:inorganic pyrophosphatase
VDTVRELPAPIREQIEHFFAHYKDLERGKWVKVEGWHGPQDAKRAILESIERYAKSPEKPQF